MRLGIRIALALDCLDSLANRRVTKEMPVSLPSYAVDFRGHPACPCQAKWLPAFEHEAQRRGILTGPLPLSQIIGDAKQSGNTHSGGGADDTCPLTTITDVYAYVWLSRQMGADATWERPYNWDGKGGVAHVHRVLTGCPHNGPARYQIDDVRAGLNGLANHGPDTGPRPLSGRTWREGIKWAKQQEENDMEYKDWSAESKKALADDVAQALLDAPINTGTGPKAEAQFKGVDVRGLLKSLARAPRKVK